MKKNYIILFSGILWGIFEATGGWLLHLFQIKQFMPVLIAIGIISMTFATFKTKVLTAPILVAIIAASIKFLNIFFLAGRPLLWVLNPVIYIMIEGFLCAVLTVTIGVLFYKNNPQWILFPYAESKKY